MAISFHAGMAAKGEHIHVNHVSLHDLREALAQGWEDFMSKRGDLVFIGFIYPTAILFGIIYAYHSSILPLMFPLLAGSVLFGPAVASGFYELARRRELGLDARWRHFLDVLRSPSAPSLFMLTAINVIVYTLWITSAWYIYSKTLGTTDPEAARSFSTFMQAVFTTPAGIKMMVIGNLVGLGFAILALAISIVSFPMLVDHPVHWVTALNTSLRVAWKNPIATLAWGLIVVALLVIGSIPALVGLAVVLPVLGYATWHLYKHAVVI